VLAFGDFVCHPYTGQGDVNEFISNAYLSDLCNSTYADCEGPCDAF